MKHKTYQGHINFKADADETGEFSAVFATFNVIDHDGDVTVPGAFHEGQETLIEAWNHNYGLLPVGKGIIHQDDEKAWIDGAFFLDTQAGAEHYRVVKNLGSLQEWSYTFDIENGDWGQFESEDVYYLKELDVWGVAPVTRGAGIGTQTTAIKRQKQPGEGTPEPDTNTQSEGGEGEGDNDVSKPSDAELMRLTMEIISIGVGEDPAEE